MMNGADRPNREAKAGTGSRQAPEVESTVDLLARFRAGDRSAVDALFQRYLPPLRRWARGRLPRFARDLLETEDVVQETMVHAFRRLDQFEFRHDGALHAYLRQAVVNRIRDEVRKAQRRPLSQELDTHDHEDQGVSPLEEAIGQEALERYEQALGRLRDEDRQAVVLRVELGLAYAEVAQGLGKNSADAARMAVARALIKLAAEMEALE
ncbi:MAG: sigma-70 family RNA polymerase sigma factor [Luteitalea sp.]|nr:sigma-70 family RNA polymerase sigma factor [Luteitalea sp.]